MKAMRSWRTALLASGLLLASAAWAVAEPARPAALKLPKVVSWMLNTGGPCPNCDAAQTWVGRKPTPLPSPLPPQRKLGPVPTAPITPEPSPSLNPLDEMTWSELRLLLPPGLRAKQVQ